MDRAPTGKACVSRGPWTARGRFPPPVPPVAAFSPLPHLRRPSSEAPSAAARRLHRRSPLQPSSPSPASSQHPSTVSPGHSKLTSGAVLAPSPPAPPVSSIAAHCLRCRAPPPFTALVPPPMPFAGPPLGSQSEATKQPNPHSGVLPFSVRALSIHRLPGLCSPVYRPSFFASVAAHRRSQPPSAQPPAPPSSSLSSTSIFFSGHRLLYQHRCRSPPLFRLPPSTYSALQPSPQQLPISATAYHHLPGSRFHLPPANHTRPPTSSCPSISPPSQPNHLRLHEKACSPAFPQVFADPINQRLGQGHAKNST